LTALELAVLKLSVLVYDYNHPMLDRILRILDFLALTLAVIIAATADAPQLTGTADRVRSFTREIEFDYPNWVWNAAWIAAQTKRLSSNICILLKT